MEGKVEVIKLEKRYQVIIFNIDIEIKLVAKIIVSGLK